MLALAIVVQWLIVLGVAFGAECHLPFGPTSACGPLDTVGWRPRPTRGDSVPLTEQHCVPLPGMEQ